MVGWLAGSLAEVGKLWKRASLKLDATGASTVARAPRPFRLHKVLCNHARPQAPALHYLGTTRTNDSVPVHSCGLWLDLYASLFHAELKTFWKRTAWSGQHSTVHTITHCLIKYSSTVNLAATHRN